VINQRKFALPLAFGLGALLCGSLAGQDPTRQVRVDTVIVEGNQRLTDPIVQSTFGLQAGQLVGIRDIQAAEKNLWSTGHFEDIQVFAEGMAGESATLVLRVREQPIIRQLRFEGLEHVDPGDVRDTTGMLPGAAYSPVAAGKAIKFIRDELAAEGIPFARIDERREGVDGAEGQIDLIFDVSVGNRVAVAQVEFQGNEELGDDELIGAIQTKPEAFWWFRDGGFDQATYEEDLGSRLLDLYSSRGYLDFEVLSDTVMIDPQTGKARIEVAVAEGERYEVAEFSIEGNRLFPTEDLETYFAEDEGGLLASLGFGGEAASVRYFDATAFQEATARVSEAYRNNGYLYATVDPFMETHEGEDGEGPSVSIGWRINEGLPAYVNRIEIEGNDFTYDRVVRERVFLLPGDVYSEAALFQSYQQISALGFFESPMEPPSIEPGPDGNVDITFHVAERQTGSVNFGTAVGGGVGVNGFLGYDQPNLFGQGKQGHLRWDFGSQIQNFTLTYSDPAIRGSRLSGTVSLFDSRNRFFTFSSGRYKRTGASVRAGLPIPWDLRTRMFFGYSIARTRYDQFDNADDTSLFGLPDGTLSTLTTGITRSTLNHPLFPTQGSQQSINSEFSGGLIGGDAKFSKHTLEGTWYVPAGQLGDGLGGVRFAVGLKARMGAIVGDASQFPFERFFVGGVQFGESLRGYEETTVTPGGHFPRDGRGVQDVSRLGDAFLTLSAEYAIRFNDNLSLSMFYDAGNVWTDVRHMDPTQLLRGAGFGVQIVTPFGPLGLDYAYGFDKIIPGWKLHFKLGQGF